MTKTAPGYVGSSWKRLTPKFQNERFRKAYFEKSLKAFIANQIRALRGDDTQTEFGDRVGMPQSVISRLEDENYGKQNTQTLIDLAQKNDMALIIKFVDYKTFLEATEDMSPSALVPKPFKVEDLETTEPPTLYDSRSGGGLTYQTPKMESDSAPTDHLMTRMIVVE